MSTIVPSYKNRILRAVVGCQIEQLLPNASALRRRISDLRSQRFASCVTDIVVLDASNVDRDTDGSWCGTTFALVFRRATS